MPSRSAEPHSRRRSWLRVLGVAYLVLLAASHLAELVRSDDVELPPGVRAHALPVADGGELWPERPAKVDMAYAEWSPADERQEAPVVVLLHGSPGRGNDFDRMGPGLGQRFRVLAPSLPGFGASTRDVPDYSIEAHALYVERWLEDLGVESYHVVGFSLGGGVALHLAERHPERLRSLTLLSSIGLQDYELLGQYHLNHIVHGAQLAFFWLLQEGVPHFGALDGAAVAYARNFYDTDQRPLKPILESLEMPVLILHGEEDVLVPIEAAHEHHRIIPQSELSLFGANHFMVFLQPEELNAVLTDFFDRAEDGKAVRREDATPERLAAAAAPRGPMPPLHGFALAVWMLLVGLATLTSEDLTCIAAGLIVAKGRVEFLPAVIACTVGIFIGDFLLYLLGRMGRRSLTVRPMSWIVKPKDLEKSRVWFDQRGAWVVCLCRFVPGTRLPTYVTAGLLRMNPFWFAVQLLVPAALWTPVLVGLAWFFGESAIAKLDAFSRWALPGFIALLLTVWISLYLGRVLASHRGRRHLLGWWRRKVHWEFWPLPVFYLPVVLRILGLAWKHRSLAVFTAANPGLPAGGGFVGESKSEILAKIDPERVARFQLLGPAPLHRRIEEAEAFLEASELGYPVVLKPDRGERGKGVTIARSADDVAAFLRSHAESAVVQEYVGGVELGVFYVRHPDEEKGRIFAVTDKRLPEVVGNGKRTVADLILEDKRAVALHAVYTRNLGERALHVPTPGERVRLVEIGTHCRGAVFLDGAQHVTPALEEAVDRLSRGVDGFYFGRYDLRAPSYDAFGRGEFQVIELNGVTSEATNVYDPKYRLRDAYGILFEQWRLAFEIGAANGERGVEPASVRELLGLLRASRRKS